MSAQVRILKARLAGAGVVGGGGEMEMRDCPSLQTVPAPVPQVLIEYTRKPARSRRSYWMDTGRPGGLSLPDQRRSGCSWRLFTVGNCEGCKARNRFTKFPHGCYSRPFSRFRQGILLYRIYLYMSSISFLILTLGITHCIVRVS